MRTQQLKNGDIAILADNMDRAELADAYRRDGYYAAEGYVLEALLDTLDQVRPEWIGALTDSPIFAESAIREDDGNLTIEGPVYWFPNYQVTDPYRQLANTGRVVFQNEINA